MQSQSIKSLFDNPDCSGPKRIAIFLELDDISNKEKKSFVCGLRRNLFLAEVPTTKLYFETASFIELNILTFFIINLAFAAASMSFWLGHLFFGDTRIKSSNPQLCIALKANPIFSGNWGLTNTIVGLIVFTIKIIDRDTIYT